MSQRIKIVLSVAKFRKSIYDVALSEVLFFNKSLLGFAACRRLTFVHKCLKVNVCNHVWSFMDKKKMTVAFFFFV